MRKFLITFLMCWLLAGVAYGQPADATTDGPSKPIAASAAPDGGNVADAAVKAVTEPSEPSEVPSDVGGAVDAAKKVVELGKAKQWFAMSAGAIWLFMFLFKLGRKTVWFMKKIPKRVLWILVPLLSVAAMVLSKLQEDMSWASASAVLMSGPSVAFLNDLVKRGVLGREPTNGVKGGA